MELWDLVCLRFELVQGDYILQFNRSRPRELMAFSRLCDTNPRIIDSILRVFVSMAGSATQRQIARTVLAERRIARLAELRNAGVTAATMPNGTIGRRRICSRRGPRQFGRRVQLARSPHDCRRLSPHQPAACGSVLPRDGFRWSQRVVTGSTVRKTRHCREIVRTLWSRVPPALQLPNVFRAAIGRQMRRSLDGGISIG
jgi:hypothetical protein